MKTWMLVEDEPDLYEMVLAMYESLGVEGVAFGTGEEAMDWIEDVDSGHFEDHIPELALIDIRLPGKIDGAQVAARLRQSPGMHNMAIVLMTAWRLSKKQENLVFRVSGCDLLLYKPLPKMEELRSMFDRLLVPR